MKDYGFDMAYNCIRVVTSLVKIGRVVQMSKPGTRRQHGYRISPLSFLFTKDNSLIKMDFKELRRELDPTVSV
jgi:hypothetical protein